VPASEIPSYESLKGMLFSLFIVAARVSPLFILMPFMNRALVPRMVRFAMSAGIGFVLVPVFPAGTDAWPSGIPLLALIFKEAVIGVLLGFVIAIPFWAFEAIGFVIDNQRGASMAATLNPMTGHDSSPLGIAFNFAFITFFLLGGGIHLFLGLIYDSYRLWSPLEFWPAIGPEAAALLMVQLNRLVMLALLLAAPVLIAMLMSELGLALVSRFAPQLQVFFLAMPIKSALALFVLVIYSSTLFDYSLAPIRELATWVDRLDPLLRLGGR
jgi:type III secretion protein T